MNLRKRAAPVGRREKLHERMERELTNLMHDRRYWEGDPGYRAHVRRQFERVYNDPSGKPGPLRIGAPQIFATEIEPFGVGGERLTAPVNLSGESSTTSSTRKMASPTVQDPESATAIDKPPVRDPGRQVHGRGRPPNGIQRLGMFTNTPPGLEPKISDDGNQGSRFSRDNEPDDLTKTYDYLRVLSAEGGSAIERAQARSQLLLDVFKEYGWETAARTLQHYLGGTGEPIVVSLEVLGQYPTLRRAYGDVLKYFTQWLIGVRSDTQHGNPALPLRDGEKLTIGVPPGRFQKDLAQLIMWEANFPSAATLIQEHPIFLRALGSESHAVFGSGRLQGFANSLVLVRDGDLIKITGDLTFRAKDTYDFEEGDTFGFRDLEDAALAKSFDITTGTWRLEVEGFIRLRDDQPISAELKFVDYGRAVRVSTIDQPFPTVDDVFPIGP